MRLELFFRLREVEWREELEEAQPVGVSSPACTYGIKSP
jgi:hypothetical protein